MTCSVCLTTTPALQTIPTSGCCPLCGTDYQTWRHTSSVPTSWARTHKLRPNGQAQRDRLIAARLALRSDNV